MTGMSDYQRGMEQLAREGRVVLSDRRVKVIAPAVVAENQDAPGPKGPAWIVDGWWARPPYGPEGTKVSYKLERFAVMRNEKLGDEWHVTLWPIPTSQECITSDDVLAAAIRARSPLPT